MRVHHISAASMCPIGERLINGEGRLLARALLVCHCWLIESDDGLVLVDTGFGTEDLAHLGRLGLMRYLLAPRSARHETALAKVEALGFSRADVRHIIPTHLDLDHAGGLPDFPDATVHVFAAEHRLATQPGNLQDRVRYRRAHFAHGPRWDLRDEDGEPWFGFEGVRAIDRNEEILLIPLIGHTLGHCGVAVRREGGGWLLHAGDAYFSRGDLETPPACPLGLRVFQRLAAVDNRQRLRNQERLRALVHEHGDEVEVHSAHCPFEFRRF